MTKRRRPCPVLAFVNPNPPPVETPFFEDPMVLGRLAWLCMFHKHAFVSIAESVTSLTSTLYQQDLRWPDDNPGAVNALQVMEADARRRGMNRRKAVHSGATS